MHDVTFGKFDVNQSSSRGDVEVTRWIVICGSNTDEEKPITIGVGFVHRGLSLISPLYIVRRAPSFWIVVDMTKWTQLS